MLLIGNSFLYILSPLSIAIYDFFLSRFSLDFSFSINLSEFSLFFIFFSFYFDKNGRLSTSHTKYIQKYMFFPQLCQSNSSSLFIFLLLLDGN